MVRTEANREQRNLIQSVCVCVRNVAESKITVQLFISLNIEVYPTFASIPMEHAQSMVIVAIEMYLKFD